MKRTGAARTVLLSAAGILLVTAVAAGCIPAGPAGPADAGDPARRASVERAAGSGEGVSVALAMPVLRPDTAFFSVDDRRPLDATLVATDLWYVVLASPPRMVAIRIRPDGEPEGVGSDWVSPEGLLAARDSALGSETRLVDIRGRTVLLASRAGRTEVLPIGSGGAPVVPVAVDAYTAELRASIPLDPGGLASIPGIVWVIVVLVGVFPLLALGGFLARRAAGAGAG